MDEDDNIQMQIAKHGSNIVRLEIRSRHVNRKTYKVYIDYEASRNEINGIRRYWCECPNGNRTVGCCSHVAAGVYYLSYARYLPFIFRPAAGLTDLFVPSGGETESEESD